MNLGKMGTFNGKDDQWPKYITEIKSQTEADEKHDNADLLPLPTDSTAKYSDRKKISQISKVSSLIFSVSKVTTTKPSKYRNKRDTF